MQDPESANQFFYEHAGWGYDPATETPEEGRRRSAADLASSERWGKEVGLEFQWEDDWGVGNHYEEYGEAYSDGEPETCESCIAYLNGELVASLGCIDGATPEYRRVVEAELASEARFEIRQLSEQMNLEHDATERMRLLSEQS